jgi:hypothetical protein
MRLGCSSQEMGRGCPHDAIAAGGNIEASPRELVGAQCHLMRTSIILPRIHQPSSTS